jgi:hypothetical protein
MRQSTIRPANVGPTPGNPSICCSVARFRFIKGVDSLVIVWLALPSELCRATAICSPSLSNRARFTLASSANRVKPSAANIASATLAPESKTYKPARLTWPTTCTNILGDLKPALLDGKVEPAWEVVVLAKSKPGALLRFEVETDVLLDASFKLENTMKAMSEIAANEAQRMRLSIGFSSRKMRVMIVCS